MSENSEKTPSRVGGQIGLVDRPQPGITRQEMLYLESYQEQLKRTVTNLLKKQVKADLAAGYYDTQLYSYSELLRNSSEVSGPRSKDRLITISLPNTAPLNLLQYVERWNKIIRKLKFIPKGAIWVYEQRGEVLKCPIQGLHIHIVMTSAKYPNEIARDLAAPFGITKNYVDVTDRDRKVALNYVLGEKSDKSKAKKQQIDRVMREQYGIANSYEK